MSRWLSDHLAEAHAAGSEQGLTLKHWCAGCDRPHYINVEKKNASGARWAWDRNVTLPTFSPSVNIVGHCHYTITAGMVTFHGDSAHALAGSVRPLPAMPATTTEDDDAD